MKQLMMLFLAGILSFPLIGCDKISIGKTKQAPLADTAAAIQYQSKGPIVATFNKMPITLDDLNREIDAYNSMVPADKPELKITTKEMKLDYLKKEMKRKVLLYQEGLKKGLDKKDEVVQAMEKTRQDLLVMEMIREEAQNVAISDKDIEDYYNTYKEQLKDPEQREIREIVVLTESEAKEIMIQLFQGADFSTLARERSKSPSAKDGGNLGYISPGKKSDLFDSYAFSNNLEVGKVSNYFKGPDGYYILKLEGKTGGQQKPFSAMKDDIRRGLTFLEQQKRIDKLIADLEKGAAVELFEGEVR